MPSGKTNAVRLLDSLNVSYELRDYEVDLNDLSAETVARKIGLPPEQVFKTLATQGDRTGICLAVIAGSSQLNAKSLAQITGDRSRQLLPLKQVLPVTGYMRGAVTPLACKKEYPVVIDETAELYPMISVSAGVRGTQILLSPVDYIRVTKATVAEIVSF